MEVDFSKNSWSGHFVDVSEDDTKKMESVLSARLPPTYKSIIEKRNGMSFKENILTYYDNSTARVEQTCIKFIAYETKRKQPWLAFTHPAELFPSGLLAFAFDPGDDMVCFDYRHLAEVRQEPSVVLWHFEAAGRPEAITPLADNFEAFLGMLKSEEEAEKEFQEMKKRYEKD